MDFRRELIVKPDLEPVSVFCRLAQVPESLHFPIFGAVYRSPVFLDWTFSGPSDPGPEAWDLHPQLKR